MNFDRLLLSANELAMLSERCDSPLTDEMLAALEPAKFPDVIIVQLQSSSEQLKELGPIADFGSQLTHLNLYSVKYLASLAGLEWLTGLSYLRISDSDWIENPQQIGTLVNLQKLMLILEALMYKTASGLNCHRG